MENILNAFFQSLQSFIIPFLVRNILKIGGTIFAYAGWEENDITFFVAGIIAMIFGTALSWIRDKILKTSK